MTVNTNGPPLPEHRPISEHHHAGQLCPLGSGCSQPSGPEPLRWPHVAHGHLDERTAAAAGPGEMSMGFNTNGPPYDNGGALPPGEPARNDTGVPIRMFESDTPREPVDPAAVYSWRAEDGSTQRGAYPPEPPTPFYANVPERWQDYETSFNYSRTAGPTWQSYGTPQLPPPYLYRNSLAGDTHVHVGNSRPGVNHVLHLVLTLLTCGAWAPVWILLAILEAMRK